MTAPSRSRRLASAGTALLAIAILAVHFGGAEVRDTPIHTDVRFFLAGGKLIAGGAVPYRDFAETKPPLAPVVSAGFERAAAALGTDGLVAVRVGFLALAALGGFLRFWILRRLGGGAAAGLVGVLAYVGFPVLRALPEIGAVPKLLMGVLASAAALFAYRRRWGLAGACAALAALDWQLGALCLAGVVVVAALETAERGRAVGAAIAGAAVVGAGVVAALASVGALGDAWRQAVVAVAAKGAGSLAQQGIDFRLERLAKTIAPGAADDLWLVVLGLAGAAVFALWLWCVRRSPERRLAWPLAAYHYGILAFSFVDFQGFGDLLALFASLAFFAAVALVEVMHLAQRALTPWLASRAAAAGAGGRAEAGDAGRGVVAALLPHAVAAVFVAAMAIAVAPGLSRGDPFAGRDRRRIPNLAAQRAIAGELVERTAGGRVGFVGCAELMYLTEIPNRLPLVRWNPPIHAALRRSAGESSTETLLWMIDEARLDAIVCPDRALRRELLATGTWERVVLGGRTLPRRARVTVLVRRGATDGVEQPYSAQLHVHGSFSEGAASIDSHSHEAADVGADVVWWSDHDFRIATYRHATRFGFEDWSEPIDRDEPETVRPPDGRLGLDDEGHARRVGRRGRRGDEKRVLRPAFPAMESGWAEITADARDEGERSLRVGATGGGDEFAAHLHHVEAARGLFKRPLATGVTLRLSVLPERAGPDARPAIEIGLSEHAPRDGIPLDEVYRLVYVLDNQRTEPERIGGAVFLPIPYRPGEWNRLELPVTRDAIRSFPAIRGDDNAFGWIGVGMQVRRGASGSALFDRLVIEQESRGEATFARQRELIDAVAAGYPSLSELQGVEISYGAPHLNEFSVDTRLLDYDSVLAAGAERGADADWDPRAAIAMRAVADAHARGGLVSYNHMFGAAREGGATRSGVVRDAETKEEVLEELTANRLYGADILEVGYRHRGGRSLEEHLWVWDQLAQRGLHPVGTGVSDSHGGPDQRWRTAPNNFLSWIYARKPEKADLIEGLRAGRVYFGDIVLFDGVLDLVSDRGHRMGSLVVTDRAAETVAIRIDGLAAGDSVDVVESGRRAATLPVESSEIQVSHEVALAERPTVVRVEVRGAGGGLEVLSNPITFLRTVPAGGIEPARAGIDLAGVVSDRIEGFRIDRARTWHEGDATFVELHGRASDGWVELHLEDAERGEFTVELDGLRGRKRLAGNRVEIRELAGEGAIRVRRPTP